MTLTFENITNGWVLYYPTFVMDYSGNYAYTARQTGVAREYFPTLDMVFRKMADLFDHEMPSESVRPRATEGKEAKHGG